MTELEKIVQRREELDAKIQMVESREKVKSLLKNAMEDIDITVQMALGDSSVDLEIRIQAVWEPLVAAVDDYARSLYLYRAAKNK
jgi:hypothetical protein